MCPAVSQTLTPDTLPHFHTSEDHRPTIRQVTIYLNRLLDENCPEENKQVFIPSAMNLAEHMNITPFEVTSALDKLKDQGVDSQYLSMESHITLTSKN